MQRLVIRGGRPLSGSVAVHGAKNAALPILAAALLTTQPTLIRRIPRLRDVAVMVEILRAMGARVETRGVPGGWEVAIEPTLSRTEVPPHLTRLMRSSIFLMGAVLARCGRMRISYPGGCVIGPRPIDLHLEGLKRLGAVIEEAGGFITALAPRLQGAEIHLDFPSVGATENLMMAAVLARGRSVIRNAAKEPEIVDLQNFVNRMGARVQGAGTDVIHIDGVSALTGATHQVIPDRVEAATLMIAGAITGGDVEVTGMIPEHVEAVTAKLREAGADVVRNDHSVRVRGPVRPRAVNLKTLPYPGFPTDVQNQFLALMCTAAGASVITESIYEQRLKVAEELRRMGARIHVEGRVAVVRGVSGLYGADVQAADDLRGGAALVLAGLRAEGVTTVNNAEFLDRGYQDFEHKLAALGADIHRLAHESDAAG